MEALQRYITFCRNEQWKNGVCINTVIKGDTVVLEEKVLTGVFFPQTVDIADTGFEWDRAKIDAYIPQDAGIRVYAIADDVAYDEDVRELWNRGVFGEAASSGSDLIIGKSGRYLYLAIELMSGGSERPMIRGISLKISGDHMVDHLPGIYQGEDFTYRYLSIFNSISSDLERQIDAMPSLFNLGRAPEEMYGYLAEWFGVRGENAPEKARDFLPHILEHYELMYTPSGIEETATLYAGKPPILIEHFEVDPNDPSCVNPGLYRQLYGDDPYRLFLMFPEDTFQDREEMELFRKRMNEAIPAGCEMELIILKPCVRLDQHTYLGINSTIESYIPATINESMSIDYDMTIGDINMLSASSQGGTDNE